MPKNLFQPGNPGGPGGAREGAGRPPNDFYEWLGDLIHSQAARTRFEKIIKDEGDADEKVTDQGVQVPIRAKAQTYIQALELAWSYMQGKPNQPVSLTDERDRPPLEVLVNTIRVLREELESSRKGSGVASGK